MVGGVDQVDASPDAPAEDGVTIGELARRVGVTTHALRAWERRYALTSPRRTAGGYRLYLPSDEHKVRRFLALRAAGLPTPAAAARANSADQGPGAHGQLGRTSRPGTPTATRGGLSRPTTRAVGPATTAATFRRRLDAKVHAFDPTAYDLLDEAITALGLATALQRVVLPYLVTLGQQWADGTASVAQEHFASHVIRRRVSAETIAPATPHAWPAVVLACPPGERHDIGLLAFSALLARDGWAVRYLGADTPLASLFAGCRSLSPDLVVLAATRTTLFEARASALHRIAAQWPLAIAGAGAQPAAARHVGATALSKDLSAAVGQARALVGAAGRA
jgi:MerR family transcriptional regulator, light-induced transcriptional regulator